MLIVIVIYNRKNPKSEACYLSEWPWSNAWQAQPDWTSPPTDYIYLLIRIIKNKKEKRGNKEYLRIGKGIGQVGDKKSRGAMLFASIFLHFVLLSHLSSHLLLFFSTKNSTGIYDFLKWVVLILSRQLAVRD